MVRGFSHQFSPIISRRPTAHCTGQERQSVHTHVHTVPPSQVLTWERVMALVPPSQVLTWERVMALVPPSQVLTWERVMARLSVENCHQSGSVRMVSTIHHTSSPTPSMGATNLGGEGEVHTSQPAVM